LFSRSNPVYLKSSIAGSIIGLVSSPNPLYLASSGAGSINGFYPVFVESFSKILFSSGNQGNQSVL
jgi:hypothetical protein